MPLDVLHKASLRFPEQNFVDSSQPLVTWLLFAADALMPRTVNEIVPSGPTLPRVRIHSERKGPEAVVIDTNQRAIVPAHTEQPELLLGAQTFAPHARVRQSFAQLLPPSQISAGENDPKKEARKLQPKRKVMTVRRKHQPVAFVQRQYFGFFDTLW